MTGDVAGAGSGAEHRRLLGEILRDLELVNDVVIEESLAIQRTGDGALLGEILIRLGYLEPEELAVALSIQSRLDGKASDS